MAGTVVTSVSDGGTRNFDLVGGGGDDGGAGDGMRAAATRGSASRVEVPAWVHVFNTGDLSGAATELGAGAFGTGARGLLCGKRESVCLRGKGV